MAKVDAGRDVQFTDMAGDVVGAKGTATGSGATSLTDSGATWGTTQFVRHLVVAVPASGGLVTGLILSHTGTVLTVDRWTDVTAPGGAAGTTPSTTGQYAILSTSAPSWFMALTANNGAPSNADTTLTGEITTGGGGLIRKICPVAHTAGASTYTQTPVYTANGSDTLPVTIAKIGTFNSLTSGQLMFETLLGTTATLSLSGDQLTITQTVTM